MNIVHTLAKFDLHSLFLYLVNFLVYFVIHVLYLDTSFGINVMLVHLVMIFAIGQGQDKATRWQW